MRVLIVGGAGYIGSHMNKMLVRSGHQTMVLDNLSTGYREAVHYGSLVVGDLSDSHLLEKIFLEHEFDGVMHFAANSLVGESVHDPSKYYKNNVAGTLVLLDAMIRHGIKNFIFSSTAAIFGEPHYTPIDELHPQSPINPYGASKLMIERVLEDYSKAYGLNSVSLRYFNACGADPEGEIGECHNPETHLIPLILQAASGRRDKIVIYGRDYPTLDGTCVRDYIHVQDLCRAHELALQSLISGQINGARFFNLGNGSGFSVQQVFEAAQSLVSKESKVISVMEGGRRDGDPAVLVSDSQKAKQELGWEPCYDNLSDILIHAWKWEKHLAGLV